MTNWDPSLQALDPPGDLVTKALSNVKAGGGGQGQVWDVLRYRELAWNISLGTAHPQHTWLGQVRARSGPAHRPAPLSISNLGWEAFLGGNVLVALADV